MSKGHKILRTSLAEHPAVRAWHKLRLGSTEPGHIVVFKNKQKGAVYGLAGIGPDGSRVIAKRCDHIKGTLERIVYEHVLPQLRVVPFNYYGAVEGGDDASVWLFFEDIGAERYDPDVQTHRALAAQWFGELQVTIDRDTQTSVFPDRGPDFYFKTLQSIIEWLPVLRERQLLWRLGGGILERIFSRCQVLESDWSAIDAFCATVPTAFTHGDCLEKNVHIRNGSAGPRLAPFDWGGAGWAPAAIDLGQLALPHRGPPETEPDYDAYRCAVADRWPALDIDTIRRLAGLGQLFWALKVINRALPEFECDWRQPEHIVADLEFYERALLRSTGTEARWW